MRDFLDALIDVEEHDEEHQRDAERDLRPDAEAEPQREDRRQHDARQRIGHLHIGIEHRGDPRLAREPEADHDAAERADHESQDRFPQRDRQMLPDHAASEPVDDLAADIDRIGKEERRQQHMRRTPARWRAIATARARRRRPATDRREASSATSAINLSLLNPSVVPAFAGTTCHIAAITASRTCRSGRSRSWRGRPAP